MGKLTKSVVAISAVIVVSAYGCRQFVDSSPTEAAQDIELIDECVVYEGFDQGLALRASSLATPGAQLQDVKELAVKLADWEYADKCASVPGLVNKLKQQAHQAVNDNRSTDDRSSEPAIASGSPNVPQIVVGSPAQAVVLCRVNGMSRTTERFIDVPVGRENDPGILPSTLWPGSRCDVEAGSIQRYRTVLGAAIDVVGI